MNSSKGKKLLLLGGSHAEIPLIQAAKELGYFVITTGNAIHGLGHAYADKNIFADFSDKEEMLRLALEEKVDAVCSGCNDFALLSTAYVAEKLSLKGHDTYEISKIIHHKDKYRKLAEKLKIPTPKAFPINSTESLENALSKISFPIIIKPVDLTGGKGIQRVDSLEDAKKAFQNAMEKTRENYCIAEEFIEGSRHGFSCYIIQEKILFYFADNEQYFLNPYLVSGANTPSTTAQKGIEKLCEYTENIAKELHLKDGIVHIQYIETKDKVPVIIEICRRAPGDLYIKLVQHATNVNYPKMLVLAETGNAEKSLSLTELKTFSSKKEPLCFLRHCIMANQTGIVKGIYISEEIKELIVDKMLWFSKGEKVEDILHYKAGILFFRFNSKEEMEKITNNIHQFVKIEFE